MNPRFLRPLRRFVLVAALLLAVAAAPAQEITFTAEARPESIQPGGTVDFTIRFQSTEAANVAPTLPDWGGLEVAAGPSVSESVEIINGRARVGRVLQWRLRAPAEGSFTIGPSRVTVNGRTYETPPVTITARRPAPGASPLPSSFQAESILPAQSGNPQIDKELEGRLFIRAEVDSLTPYVSQPVVVTWRIYNDSVPLGSLSFSAVPDTVAGGIVEEKFRAQRLEFHGETIDGRNYQVAPLVQLIVTPTQAGEVRIGSLALRAILPLQGRRPRGGDPFGLFDDPFFGMGGMPIDLPAAPIALRVRPLPEEGQPAGFTGTVGDYSLSASAEPASLRQDELVTLRLTLQGIGAIELAGPPLFPANSNFELVDQTQELVEPRPKDRIGGVKRFELSLRPRRAGSLEIPPIQYGVFNPVAEQYQLLRTEPITINVEPGPRVAGPRVAPPGESVQPLEGEGNRALSHIMLIEGAPRMGRTQPLLASAVFWSLHAAAAGLLLVAFSYDRRRARLDPASRRRGGAWRRFERRLKQLRRQAETGDAVGGAAGLEQAMRGFIGDRFNLSPDGLTDREIERLLVGHQMAPERAARVAELLGYCAAVRYAPAGGAPEVAAWSREAETLLREGIQ